MSVRRSSLLVGLIVTTALVCLAIGIRTLFDLAVQPAAETEETPLVSGLWQCSMVGFLAVGTLLAGKRPRNPVGWVVLSLPLLIWSGFALSTVAQLRAATGVAPTALALRLDWASTVLTAPLLLTGAVFFLVTFPENHPSRTGRWVLRLTVPLAGLWAVLRATTPMPLDHSKVANPFALEIAAALEPVSEAVANVLPMAVIVAGVDVFLRHRRAVGAERQQFRWVTRSLLAAPAGIAVSSIGELVLSDDASQVTDLLGVWTIAFGLAAGTGVAVLRYRLYDIDRVVSRSVGYLVVTAMAVAIYAGSVLGLGAVARRLTGESGDVVVAISTLLVAAVFQPLRRRVQAGVERRFNRHRYDASRTVEHFGARLRDEVDLGELRADLADTVRLAIAPATISLWLPEEVSR